MLDYFPAVAPAALWLYHVIVFRTRLWKFKIIGQNWILMVKIQTKKTNTLIVNSKIIYIKKTGHAIFVFLRRKRLIPCLIHLFLPPPHWPKFDKMFRFLNSPLVYLFVSLPNFNVIKFSQKQLWITSLCQNPIHYLNISVRRGGSSLTQWISLNHIWGLMSRWPSISFNY